jgi:hypothetical protein
MISSKYLRQNHEIEVILLDEQQQSDQIYLHYQYCHRIHRFGHFGVINASFVEYFNPMIEQKIRHNQNTP